MTRRLALIWLGAGLSLAVVVYWFVRGGSGRSEAEVARLSQVERQAVIEELQRAWNSSPAVILADIPNVWSLFGECRGAKVRVPPFGLPRSREEFSAETLGDLELAVNDFVALTTESDPARYLQAMSARGMKVHPERKKLLANLLTSSFGYPNGFQESLTAEEVFLEAWKRLVPQSHWQKIVPEHCCCSFWETGREGVSKYVDIPRDMKHTQISTLVIDRYGPHAELSGLFGGKRVWHTNFTDFEELTDDLQPGRVAKFADLQLMIEHDEEYLNQRSPYFVRFWLHPVHRKWHPISLGRPRVLEDGPPALLF